MTDAEREVVAEVVLEAVLQCPALDIPVAQRCDVANLVRRDVVRNLAVLPNATDQAAA
jgi:hypothetical protein